jgi:hypothetical protein
LPGKFFESFPPFTGLREGIAEKMQFLSFFRKKTPCSSIKAAGWRKDGIVLSKFVVV